MDELIYFSLHIYYYALHGKLGEVRGSKLEVLFKYDVISVIYIVLDNEANKLKGGRIFSATASFKGN